MGLVTPFDASFWSTTEKKKKPPGIPEPPEGPTSEQVAEAINNNNKLVWDSNTGSYSQVPMSPSEATANQINRRQAAPSNPNQDNTAALIDQTQGMVPPPPTPPSRAPFAAPGAAPAAAPIARAGFTNELAAATGNRTAVMPHAQPQTPYTNIDPSGIDLTRLGQAATVAPPPQAPGAQAPDIDRSKIDSILGGLDSYQNKILDLTQDNTGLSAAEAQLMKADQLAKIRARDELAANQAGALGAARSARNPNDRALLSRQAVGEQAYLGSQAQRQSTMQQAELEGNLAILRATEGEHDRQFRLDAISKAADLGLNRAALEVDLSKANLDSANNWVNNEAKQALQNGVLDEQQYEALLNYSTNNTAQLLGFTRDMAAIQFQYDQLSTQDQQAADALLMQKYGIDQQTMVALKQIKQAGKFKWDDFLGKIIGGGVAGLTGGVGAGLVGGGGGGSGSNSTASPGSGLI